MSRPNALVNKGATAGDLGWSEDAVAAYDQVIQFYRDDPALREQVASALINKGMALGTLGRPEDAVAAFDQVIHLYRDNPALRERVATALVNTGVALGELGCPAEAVGAYNQVIDPYSDDLALREVVEWAEEGKARHQRKRAPLHTLQDLGPVHGPDGSAAAVEARDAPSR